MLARARLFSQAIRWTSSGAPPSPKRATTRASRPSPPLEELALAELLASGGFERHLRAARQRCRSKRAVLLEALAAALPGARVRGVAAGLHALLDLPQGSEERAVVAACRERKAHLQGLADFTRAQPRAPALVLGYGLPSERELREAVAAIAAAVAAPR